MSSSEPEAWARLRLVQGRASAQLWELVHSTGHTTLTVGAAPTCSWIISDTGVAPVHFTLHWDGLVLRIADTYGAGNVRVDGRPVDRTFRVVSGRARIDFGQAAIVAETSSAPSVEGAHPLDPSALAASTGPTSVTAVRSAPKGTVMGVAPPPRPPIQATVDRPPGAVTDTGSFRPSRPPLPASNKAKATLMGMSPLPTGAHTPPRTAPLPPNFQPPKSPLSGTLMGFSGELPAPAGNRVGGASLTDGDQRTIQGFPRSDAPEPRPAPGMSGVAGRRPTMPGVVTPPPGVNPDAVRETRVKSISDRALPPEAAPIVDVPSPKGAERTTLEEVPLPESSGPTSSFPHEAEVPQFGSTAAESESVPKAVLLGHEAEGQGADSAWRTPGAPGGDVDARDVPTLQSQRPKRPIPWHYVGLGLLTAAAYVAWLYLLDHL